MKFSTKANTLQMLENRLVNFHVLPQYCFTAAQLSTDPTSVERQVCEKFSADTLLIVRSSALNEDAETASSAGKYLSIKNVPRDGVVQAAWQVVQSFQGGLGGDQVFVQPMLENIMMCGVFFTVDPNTGGHYAVVNYDETGASDAVTSGEGRDLNTAYVFHGCIASDKRIEQLRMGGEELAELFQNQALDIEFAFVGEDKPVLLQVRPLVMQKPLADYEEQKRSLERVRCFIEHEMNPSLYARGKRTIYGIMPDWNPAEMIGIRPKPLAMSLYKRLITDGTWAYQRNNYGYKNLRSFPLMLDFCGLPYIDARVSFNSFVPKDIDDELSEKLVDYYIEELTKQPDKHDKVEFDIIFSCYTFDLPERVKVLTQHGFSPQEQDVLVTSLRELTNAIINVADGLWITDTNKISTLEARQDMVIKSNMTTVSKIYWLLEDCARYGTLPFAGLARAGFIAVLLLRSLVSIGSLSRQDYENYMNELNTISSQMAIDREEMSHSSFLRKYGHLRPGTYDITSPRYDANPELYLGSDSTSISAEVRSKVPFSLTLGQYEKIQREMERQGLNGDVLALFKFIKAGIEGREYSKFIFSRSLSHALELFAELGRQYGYSREDMAYLDTSVINRLYSSADDPAEVLAVSIESGKKKHRKTLSYTMPPVILDSNDIYDFEMPTGQPNFITLNTVTGEICSSLKDREALRDKILIISAADPGYDWIFSCGIKGFITAYGGANSHMAIRAGELGIPAVIGAGEKLHAKWSSARFLRIDCANKHVEVLQI